LAIEFFILFFLLPTLFHAGRFRVPALAALWVVTGYCLFVLWRTGHLREAAPAPAELGPWLLPIAGLFLAFAAATTAAMYLYAPDDLFRLLRRRPKLWALVVATYPALSVYPQAIVFGVFLFERYRLLGTVLRRRAVDRHATGF
jgi:hypothetical protein